MKYLFSIVPILFLLTSRSCDKKIEEPVTVNKFGETIELKYQEKFEVGEGLFLVYNSLADNRCPKEVNCIQAGEAKVNILLERGDQSGKVMLEAKGLCMDRSGKCGNAKAAMGYLVKLLNVDPYPEEGQRANPANSTIQVIVTAVNK